MPSYELTQAADRDLSDIYTYTYTEFGEVQADTYYQSLEECLTRLAESPQLGLGISAVRKGYRRFVHKRHSIYYKQIRSGIRVIRILGRPRLHTASPATTARPFV